MPIYEYQCPQCGHFEVMRKFSDRVLTRCPTCKAKVSKLISNTSFQLKGSGWYATDYGRNGSAAKGQSDGKSNGGSEAPKADTEAKPTAKESKAKTADAA